MGPVFCARTNTKVILLLLLFYEQLVLALLRESACLF